MSGKQLEMATIANYCSVCCEAVRLAMLATAWFLVHSGGRGPLSPSHIASCVANTP